MTVASRALSVFASTVAAFAAGTACAADLLSLRLEELMEIGVVGASKYEQPLGEVAAAASVITRQEIRAHGWRTLGDALVSLPGFTASNDRQYVYPTFRGLGLPGDYATRLLVTINGNRLNDPLYDQGTFNRMLPIDLDLVERIEFIPGPGGAVHGQNAMFGVVNLVTRNGVDLDGLELSVSGQQPQRLREGRVSWGGRVAGDTELLLSASALEADGDDRFYDFGATGISGVARGLDYERDHEWFVRARRGGWSLDVLHGGRTKGDPTASFFTDPLVAGKRNQDIYSQAQLTYQQPVDDAWEVFGRAFAGRYNSDGRGTSLGLPFAATGAARWFGGEAQVVSTAFASHKLMLGVEAQVETRRDQRFLDLTTPANDLLVSGDARRTGLYVQDEWHFTAAMSATLGLRADHNDSTGTHLSPRAGLLWQASPTTAVKALYGRAHRAPNGFEREYADGVARTANLDLSGERVDTTELVVDFRVATDLALRASVYHWKLHDIVTLGFEPGTGLAQYQSGAPHEASGVELSADHTWPSGARLRASSSLQDARVQRGPRLDNSPAWLGKIAYTQPLPWAGLSAASLWRYDGTRRTLGGDRLGSFGLLDATLVAEEWATGLTLRLALTNVFDHRYTQPASATNWQDALEQDGRSLLLTASYRF